jgi:gamma-glutamylcyclotransferase
VTILCFAYGSNMCTGRLTQRVPSAKPRFAAKFAKHQLAFHKRSDDGSGKADVVYTGDGHDLVWGVVFELEASQKANLDNAEGLEYGYFEKPVTVETPSGSKVAAVAYYADDAYKDPGLKPYCWYLRFIIDGAKQHGFPEEYVASLEAVGCVEDPDASRSSKERVIRC